MHGCVISTHAFWVEKLLFCFTKNFVIWFVWIPSDLNLLCSRPGIYFPFHIYYPTWEFGAAKLLYYQMNSNKILCLTLYSQEVITSWIVLVLFYHAFPIGFLQSLAVRKHSFLQVYGGRGEQKHRHIQFAGNAQQVVFTCLVCEFSFSFPFIELVSLSFKQSGN